MGGTGISLGELSAGKAVVAPASSEARTKRVEQARAGVKVRWRGGRVEVRILRKCALGRAWRWLGEWWRGQGGWRSDERGGRVFQEEAEAAWPGWVRPGTGGRAGRFAWRVGGPVSWG